MKKQVKTITIVPKYMIIKSHVTLYFLVLKSQKTKENINLNPNFHRTMLGRRD